MKLTKLLTTVVHLVKQNKNKSPTLQKLPKLTQLCSTKQFCTLTTTNITTTSHHRNQSHPNRITSIKIVSELIRVYWNYFILAVLVNILSMTALVFQPFVNNYIKDKIYGKFQLDVDVLFGQCVGVYVGYKCISSLLYVLADFWGMVFGVKMYSATTYKLIGQTGQTGHNVEGKFIACIEDDCQRLQNIPASSINSFSKIIQFIIFSSLLLSKLPNYASTIGLCYWLFLILSICLAIYSSKLNLKIMHSKQQRIQFVSITSKSQIQQQRNKQINMIKYLMVVDGIGLILPWLLNVGFMIVICGYVGIAKEDRYLVLTVFGLLRASISGLGTNMNYFGQAWTSLNRISHYINTANDKNNLIQPLILNNSTNLTRTSKYLGSSSSSEPLQDPKQIPTLLNLLQIASQTNPNIIFFLMLLSSLLFTSHFMYSYCAKSILMGESIISYFNLLTLALELLAPILLFWYICRCNLKMSRQVYQFLLDRDIQELRGMNAEQINRLSGDIRLLDRQLYFTIYGTISHLMGIAASFLYSIVILNNTFSSIVLTLIICLTIWVAYLCRRVITLRKQCYRKQATNKGKILNCLLHNLNPLKKWKNIYTYKIFGFAVQLTFITILYVLMIVISTIILVIVLLSSAGVEESSIMVMLISQLDSQFLVLFVQVMMLQTVVTAVSRCFAVVATRKTDWKEDQAGKKSGESSLEVQQNLPSII